jgi:cell division protein FtsB
MINYIAFATSLLVAGVAAWFSVIGLATIFSGSWWPVIVMGGVLEVGKLVTAGFLHINWNQINALMKSYLSAAVLVLMLITSLGIFGFLAKANIDKRLQAKEAELTRIETRTANLDTIINTARPQDRNYIDRKQRDERAQIAADIDLVVEDIVRLNEDKLPLQREQLVQEGEIGPIKYVAEMIYGEDAQDKIDNAARILILFIIFAFDPLAVLLLVASLGLIARRSDVKWDDKGNVSIPESQIDTTFAGGVTNTQREANMKLKREYFPVE